MEIKGNWFFQYEEFDNMENRDPLVVENIRLLAQSCDEALSEAFELWFMRKSEGTYKGYNGVVYPAKPVVLQKIEINPKDFSLKKDKTKRFSWEDHRFSSTARLRNGIVDDLTRLAVTPLQIHIERFIKRAGLEIDEKMGLDDGFSVWTHKDFGNRFSPNFAASTTPLDRRWFIGFKINTDGILKNIFVRESLHP